MTHPAPALLLFDIDGTLVLTGGAGQRAMDRAFEAVFGVPAAFDGIEMPGRTDTIILADAFARHGLPAPGAPVVRRFRETYAECLAEEVRVDGPGKRVLPGIRPLLDALARDSTAMLALLTGNFRESAEIKLAHFDLWRYFACGAFGDDAADRNLLVPVAVERARLATSRVLVIGDTPRDVACAHAAGARCLAVATGSATRETLAGAGADAVFDDLSDTPAVLAAISVLTSV